MAGVINFIENSFDENCGDHSMGDPDGVVHTQPVLPSNHHYYTSGGKNINIDIGEGEISTNYGCGYKEMKKYSNLHNYGNKSNNNHFCTTNGNLNKSGAHETNLN